MGEPHESFVLIDLISQGSAVERHICGWPKNQILKWLERHGSLRSWIDIYGNEVYHFESAVGRAVSFYLDGDRFVFIGDHTTFRPK